MKRDVTIIGASIAGLTAAHRLAREGVAVRVFEAQAPFKPAERTLIVTPAFLGLLRDANGLVLNQISTFELISAHRSIRIPLREPDIVLDRAQLLSLLLRKVESSGGKVLFGHRLISLNTDSNCNFLNFITDKDKELSMTATKVLGADGVHSTVSRMLEQDGLNRVGLAQARVFLPPDLKHDTVRVWFDRKTTRFFYWLIPESPQTGAVGLIADSLEEAQRLLEQFISDQGFVMLDWQPGANVPLYPLKWGGVPTGNRQVFLAGDAAGQVKVTTVGGVVTGMRGGLAAARSILRNTSYDFELRSLQAELLAHAMVRHVLDRFTNEDYDQLLKLLNRRTIEILGHYHRDNLTRALWLILLSQPKWVLLASKALAKIHKK